MHDDSDIWGESLGEGRGASFFIKIPILYEATKEEVKELALFAENGTTPSGSVKAKREVTMKGMSKPAPPALNCVLLVDDSPLVRKMLRRLIVSIWPDVQVLEADDGIACLDQIDSGRAIDAIIMDVRGLIVRLLCICLLRYVASTTSNMCSLFLPLIHCAESNAAHGGH